MKKLAFLALVLVSLAGTSCTKDEPVVRTRTRHVHHYHRDNGPAVGTPSSESAEGFRAVEKPSSYSGQ